MNPAPFSLDRGARMVTKVSRALGLSDDASPAAIRAKYKAADDETASRVADAMGLAPNMNRDAIDLHVASWLANVDSVGSPAELSALKTLSASERSAVVASGCSARDFVAAKRRGIR